MRTPALLLTLSAASLLAQTAKPPVHHTAAAAHHTESTIGGCAHLPELSANMPALPAGTSCPRPLFIVTRTPEIHADYVSPLVSPELRAVLAPEPTVISLLYADEKVGSGPLIEHGKNTQVLYHGYLADGTLFDSSTDAAKPFSFPLGGHRVIPGWDMGLEGMHIGGKRRLFIPYQLAYGEAGRPPKIPAKAMLIFDIEILGQNNAPEPSRFPVPQGMPAHPATPPPSSPAGAAAPPPVNSTTPAATAQPTPPSSATPKQ